MTDVVKIGFTNPWLVGASRRFVIPVFDKDGNPKDLTGATVASFRVTDISPLEGTPTALFEEKTLGAGVTIGNTNEMTIEVDEADTDAATPGDYYFEARVQDLAGDTDSTTYGYIRLSPTLFTP